MCEREFGFRVMLVGGRGRAARGGARDDEGRTKGEKGERGEEGINEREGVDNNNNTQYQKSTPKRNIVQVHRKALESGSKFIDIVVSSNHKGHQAVRNP